MGILYGNSSSVLAISQGVTKLSELQIDDDKDWNGFGITNLKELAVGMGTGDVLTHNGSILVKLSQGNIGDELATQGAGSPAIWQAPPPLS